MKRSLVVVAFIIVSACGSPGINTIEGQSTNLVKESHSVQADENGLVEFAIPDLREGTGAPLVQTYEVGTQKFQHLLLVHVPHALDASGVVYVETDPGGVVVVVVVQ